MDKAKLNKIFISTVAATEVLTLFPVIFFGITSTIDSVEVIKSSANPMIIMGFAMFYMFAALFCAFKAIQNIQNRWAYVYLAIPLVILGTGYFLRNAL